ncbi:glycosyltransferase [Sinomonas sp. JGH33]|uniref:D-inositol 3-phosphate glycosyltransferase n=1 Tax=Sinomonas terricola TaxID=3110330 RepID=A0ABU5T166_9MICC|nr:glycosyltransferase [Sinomonas sp. JGH33]MEA5453400.1 glycosyltransferase [Sinomonas sp. JGH33]
MRILHVLTLVTPDGSLGGPLRVAVNQLAALREKGHEVLLAAGARGFDGPLPDEYEGIPVRLFSAFPSVPGTGFAGLAAPAMLPWLARWARDADVVHVHLARDLVTLPAAVVLGALGVPYVVQTHGMIDSSERRLAAVLDVVATRRAVRDAQAVLALTARERSDLLEVVPGLPTPELLHNGVPATRLRARPGRSAVDVLFLARLHERKRPLVFVDAAKLLAREFPTARFSLVGPDEGQGDAVRAALASDDADGRIRWEGPLEPGQTLERMAQSSVYVLPASHEPFGMTVVEAMSVGLPVVVLNDCGLAPTVLAAEGEVCGEGAEELVRSIAALLRDPGRRKRSGAKGLAYVHERAGMAAVAARLESVYFTASGCAPS